MKEMTIRRSCDPSRWYSKTGRASVAKSPARGSEPQFITPDDQHRALNAYLDTVTANMHEVFRQE